MKKIHLYILIALVANAISCRKDIENVSDPSGYNSANFPANIDQLKSVLVGVYSAQRQSGFYGDNLFGHIMFSMEHTADNGFTGQQAWNELCVNNLNTNNGDAEGLWRALYVGVQRSNTFANLLQTYREANNGQDNEELNYMEGENLFLRAFYYYYLINFFGESFIINPTDGEKQGVPIVPALSNLENTQVPRSSVRDVWDYIINDLTQADLLLAGKTWGSNEIARVNGFAAKAFLGKAYAFTGDWANARIALKDVIDNSGKTLVPFEIYNNMYNGQNEFNNESLYEVNVSRDPSVGFGIYTGNNITTSMGLVYAPTVIQDDGTAGALGFGNIFVHDRNLRRFGFTLPIWSMVQNPSYNASQPRSINNLEMIIDPDYVRQSLELRANQTVDPRLNVSALQPWVDSAVAGGRTRVALRYKEIPSNLQPSYYGWSFRKYTPVDGSLFEFSAADNSNYYFIRLADVYLLYAEALIKTGSAVEGLEYINKVKRRAYNLPVNTPSIQDYTSLTAPTKANDPVLSNNPLRYERWAELFGEGQWWFDVCRWGIGASEAAYYQRMIVGDIQWSDAKSYKLPIPQNEINNNTAVTQSTGY